MSRALQRRPSPVKKTLLALALSLTTVVAHAEEKWQTYENCTLLQNAANDGDSFHVRAGGKEYIFRLYFVDTPETDASLPERVAEQAKYFHVMVPQTLQIGIEAERFTRARLGRPFTVVTCKQDARGRSHLPRYFAFVEIGQEDLAETLVANGLARIYGATATRPAGKDPETEHRRLQQLESNARSQKLGGWGVETGRLNTRAVTAKAAPGASSATSHGTDSFESFFHPAATPGQTLSAGGATSIPGGKLDLNRASRGELQRLPGIGPVLAARIIAARPFQSADDLARVSGIGDHKYAILRPYFR